MAKKIKDNYEHFDELVIDKEKDIFDQPKYKEYRRKWHENPDKKILADFPLNLDLCVTNRCNLRCIMCRRTQEVKKGILQEYGDMDFELYKKIIDEAARQGCYAVHISGDGEPLFHKDIIKMIQYAKEKDILDIFMHTNGTLLHEDVAAELLEAGLTRLIFSIDSPVKGTYEKIRVGANFDVVVNNIKNFMKLRKAKGLELPFVRAQMVEMKENYDQKERYDEFFKDIVDSIGHCEYVSFKKIDKDNHCYGQPKYKDAYICRQLWQRLCINYDGNVYRCLIINDHNKLGNVKDSNVKDLWLGSKMMNTRNRHLKGDISQVPSCRDCGVQQESIIGKEK